MSFTKTDSNGKKSIIRMRLAPFKLSKNHSIQFNKFKANYEKLHGTNQGGSHEYEQMVCRYFFGSYKFMEVQKGIEVLDKLLQLCPLKELTDIVRADGPRPDCAPAAVNCQAYNNKPIKHPFDKILCERNINASQ